MTGLDLATSLEKDGYKIKTKTNTSITILVQGNRIEKMLELAKKLSNMGAKYDKNLGSSSIGGIIVGNVKIFIKADGKSGGLDVEAQAINDLQDAVMCAVISNGGPITVKAGKKTVKGVVDVIKTAGTPKSDFHLADEKGNVLLHISHKKGSSSRDFQQWGGVTEDAIAKHPEVIRFGIQCLQEFSAKMENGRSAWKKIKDNDLKMMAVYGVNFAKAGLDTNKVDVLLQGDPGVEEISSGLYKLTATGHVHYHGELMSGEFEPVLAMIYKGDRTQFGVKGGRASIYPKGGRTFKQEFK